MGDFIAFLVFLAFLWLGYMWVKLRRIDRQKESGNFATEDAPADPVEFVAQVIDRSKQAHKQRRKKSDLDFQNAKYQALERLKTLYEQGALSDEEYEAEKRTLLD